MSRDILEMAILDVPIWFIYYPLKPFARDLVRKLFWSRGVRKQTGLVLLEAGNVGMSESVRCDIDLVAVGAPTVPASQNASQIRAEISGQ